MSSWKTPLLHFDCESCFISCIAPCHVYAKLKKRNYAKHCSLYVLLWYSIQTLYSWNYHLYNKSCPSKKTEYCIQLDEQECNESYMLVNSVPTKCVYYESMCIYDQTCITNYNHFFIFTFVSTTILYCFLFLLHYKLRIEIQDQKEIKDSANCLSTTCCSTCGLAQEYRELEL